jgi:ABC-type polysaccharide/polyol phosphate transport system ATPase subunit
VAVIEAQQVSKRFLLRHNATVELKVRFLNLLHPSRGESIEEFWALKGISLRIERGEAVGLVGRNGSGKSTFLKLIAAIHRPTGGRLLVSRGVKISSMIELGVGFHPELTGRENVFLNAAIHGLGGAEIERIYGAIVEYSGLEHFMDVPIKNYSSGMHMRLGFSIAANLDPDILLLDEIFAVGDADFQQRCIATIRRFMEEGKTLIFVSHSPTAIRAICRRVCVLEQGALAFDGGLEEGLAFYQSMLGTNLDGQAPFADNKRVQLGEREDAARAWQFDFLHRQGLKPGDYFLDISPEGRGPHPEIARFLLEDRYWTGVPGRVTELPHLADVAMANSVFAAQSFNSVAKTIASVVRKLKPSGRLYATWYENPDSASFEPITHPNGITTYPDREPFHYPFSLIEHICTALGATVERVAEASHWRGESVLLISRPTAS